jgi:hypothetical protein
MKEVGLADRLVAFMMLVIGAYALLAANGVSGGASLGTNAMSLSDDPVPESARVTALAIVGLFCTAGAWWFWSGRWPGHAARARESAAPLFGRAAEQQAVKSPPLRKLFFAVPLLAVLLLTVDHFALWRLLPRGAAVEQQQATAEPENVLVPEASIPSQPDQNEQTAGAPKPPTEVQQGVEIALAPDPVAPPRTLAPLPKPVLLPTLAEGHTDPVVWLAVSPDGKTILSASTDRTIKLWDLAGANLIRDIGVHRDMARIALFSPDGTRAITAGDDGDIVVRSVADGAVLHVFSAAENGDANKLAITSDGRRAVSAHESGTVIVWDLVENAVLHVLAGHDWPVVSIAVSPDGNRALSGSIDGTLKLWDVSAGKKLRSWRGHERGVYGASFTPDGRHAVTGSGDYTIKLWAVETAREIRRFNGHSGTVYAIALSQDGNLVLSGSLDGTARLWDLYTGDEISMFNPRTGPLYAVAFTVDGSILTGGFDRAIRVWPAGGGDTVALIPGAPRK